MTSLLDGLIAFLIIAVLNIAIVFRLRRSFEPAEGRFLSRVYSWTLLIRLVGAILLNVQVSDSQFAMSFWGDSETYEYGGYILSQNWSGEGFFSAPILGSVSGYGFVYFVGFVYFIFGRNQLLVQFVNGTIGSLAVVVIYAVARQLFDAKVARWPALFMAFFPQMIFWSFAMYKDPSILLCIGLSMYAVLKLREQFRPAYILLFVATGLALMSLRFYVFYMVAFATLGTFLFAQKRGLFGGLAAQIVLLLVFLGAVSFGVRGETIEQQTAYFNLERLQTARLGQAALGKSAYGAEIDVSTPQGALTVLPLGLVYLLFAPFPWAISGVRQILTLPETLVWYALMPALLRGLLHVIRRRFRDALPILVFAAVLTVAYAVFQTNVGTAYRQRTQIAMFFFIFMGVGIEERRRLRAARPTRPAYLTSAARPLSSR